MSDARGEIENLLYRYAEAIDAGDFEGIGALFAHGAIADADGNPMAQGAEAVTRLYESTTRRYPDGTPRSHHVITNPIIEIDEEAGTATGRTRYTVFQATDALPAPAHRHRRLPRPLRAGRRPLALRRAAHDPRPARRPLPAPAHRRR